MHGQIAVVDYGMGNIRSVEKGFRKVGADVVVTSDPKTVLDAPALVLPGVGAFRDCMANLGRLGLTDPIIDCIRSGKPFLGICLGLQILFEESGEFGHSRGLGIFPGRVVRFSYPQIPREFKIPHMGWNTVTVKRGNPLFRNVPDETRFYFVHSYYVVPEDAEIIAGTTEYGAVFTSMIRRENLFAVQFHPEKSQTAGLQVLSAFHELVRGSG